jgi:hypothetical protein
MSNPRVNIRPPVKKSAGYLIKAPWVLRQADKDFVDVENEGARLYLTEDSEPAFVTTNASFELDEDGTVVGCRAEVQLNMPGGNHRELGSSKLDPVRMFGEVFQLEEEA